MHLAATYALNSYESSQVNFLFTELYVQQPMRNLLIGCNERVFPGLYFLFKPLTVLLGLVLIVRDNLIYSKYTETMQVTGFAFSK